jgi:LPS export ABC transporter protein LptC
LKSKKKHRIQNIVTILIVTIFFSCKDNFDAIQQIGMFANAPAGEADDINLKYTDSSQLVANLLSPKMLDYSNRSFGFSEFPEGIELIIYDKNNNKSKVFADYAIYYDETGLIELQDNVIIATHNGDSLFTSQLYYDQKREWVFTSKRFRLRTSSSDINGRGFDSDRDFKRKEMLEMAGEVEVDN